MQNLYCVTSTVSKVLLKTEKEVKKTKRFKNFLESCRKHIAASLIATSLVGAIIGWVVNYFLPAPSVTVSNFPQKELTCMLNYGKPIYIQTANNDDFKILFKDKEVKNPFLYSITIENTGDEPILSEDFKEPLTIDFEKSNGIINASIIKSSNQNLWNELQEETEIQETMLNIHNIFLNQGDSVTIHIITDGKADVIRYNHRTVGIPDLTIRNIPAEKNQQLNIKIAVFQSLISIVIIGALVFLIVTIRMVKKEQKALNERLS